MGESREIVVLVSLFPAVEEARKVAASLLEQRLAACCNLVPGVESHYWWEGKITSGAEVLLVVKTQAAQAEAARGLIKELHSYDCPAILTAGAEATVEYVDWMRANLRD